MQQTAYRNNHAMFAPIPADMEQVDTPPNMIPVARRNSTSSLLSTQSSTPMNGPGPSVRGMNTDSLLSIDDRFVRRSRPSSRMSTGSLHYPQQQQMQPYYPPHQPQPQQYQRYYQQQQQQQQPQQPYPPHGYYQQGGVTPPGPNSVPVSAPGSRHPSLSSTSSGLYYFPNGEVFRPRQQSKSRPSRPQRVPRAPSSPSVNQQQYPQLPPPPQQHAPPSPSQSPSMRPMAMPVMGPPGPPPSQSPSMRPMAMPVMGPPGPSPSQSPSMRPMAMPAMGPPGSSQYQPQPQPQPQPQQRPPPSHGNYNSQYLNGHSSMPNLRNPNYYQQRPTPQYQHFNNSRPQMPPQLPYQHGPPSPAAYHNSTFPSPRQPRRPSLAEVPIAPNGSVVPSPRRPSLAEVPNVTANRISMSSQSSSVNNPASSSSSSTMHNSSPPSPSIDVNNQDTPASSLTCIEPLVPNQGGAFAPKTVTGDAALYSLRSHNDEQSNLQHQQQSAHPVASSISGSDIPKVSDSSLCMIEENKVIDEKFEDAVTDVTTTVANKDLVTVPVSETPPVKESSESGNKTNSTFYLSSEKSSYSSLFDLDYSPSWAQISNNNTSNSNTPTSTSTTEPKLVNTFTPTETTNNLKTPVISSSAISDSPLNSSTLTGVGIQPRITVRNSTTTTTIVRPRVSVRDSHRNQLPPATVFHHVNPSIDSTNSSSTFVKPVQSKTSTVRDSIVKSHDSGFLATLERKMSHTSVISSAIRREISSTHKTEQSIVPPVEKKSSYGFKGAFRKLFKSSSTPSNFGLSPSISAAPAITNTVKNTVTKQTLNKSASVSSKFNKFSLKNKSASSSTEVVNDSKKNHVEPTAELSDVEENNDDVLSFEVGDERKKDKKTAHVKKHSGKKHHKGPKKILDKDGEEFVLDDDLAYLTSVIGLGESDFLSADNNVKKKSSKSKSTEKKNHETEKKSVAEKSAVEVQVVENKSPSTENFDARRSVSRKSTMEKKKSISRNNTVSSCNTATTSTTSNTDSQSVITRGSRASGYSFEVEEGEYDLSYYYKHYKERHYSDQLDAEQLQIETHKRPKKPKSARNLKTPTVSCLKSSCLNYDQANFIRSSSTSLRNSNSHSSSSVMSSVSREASPSSTKSTSISPSKSSSSKTVNFSNTIYLNETFSQEAYNRFNMTLKQSYSYLHANPNKVRDIRIELNTYKQYDMAVHELSRKNTHFFHN